jgi:hypothetical protein
MIAQLDGAYARARPWKAVTRVLSWAFFEGRPVTSRLHWINPAVLALLRVARRAPEPAEPVAPVYIVGTGRSGTTVLGKILSLHPDVGFLNEPKAMWHVIHGREDLVGNFTLGPASYRLGADEATERVRANARRVFGVYSRMVGAGRVLDKYPEMVFRIPFVRAIFPDARFLFLVRDGWDTLRSMDTWSDRHGVYRAGRWCDWWGVEDRKWRLLIDQVAAREEGLDLDAARLKGIDDERSRAAVEWLLTMREGMRHLEDGNAPVELVRFEDVTRGPTRTLERILEFCGLSHDDGMLGYGASELEAVPHKEPVELRPGIERPFLETMERMGYTR